MTKVLKDILSSRKDNNLQTIEPKEMRNRQINDIREMIREGKANKFGVSPTIPSSADFFNKKRYQTKEITNQINSEQKYLYNKLRDRSKDFFKNYAGKEAGPHINLAKEYNVNRESPSFKHE